MVGFARKGNPRTGRFVAVEKLVSFADARHRHGRNSPKVELSRRFSERDGQAFADGRSVEVDVVLMRFLLFAFDVNVAVEKGAAHGAPQHVVQYLVGGEYGGRKMNVVQGELPLLRVRQRPIFLVGVVPSSHLPLSSRRVSSPSPSRTCTKRRRLRRRLRWWRRRWRWRWSCRARRW